LARVNLIGIRQHRLVRVEDLLIQICIAVSGLGDFSQGVTLFDLVQRGGGGGALCNGKLVIHFGDGVLGNREADDHRFHGRLYALAFAGLTVNEIRTDLVGEGIVRM
jgi:hypothetical protein